MPTVLPGTSRGWAGGYRGFLFTEGAGATLDMGLLPASEQREWGHWSMLAAVAAGYHCGMCSDLLWSPPILLQDLLGTCCVLSLTCCTLSSICCGMFFP